MGYYQLHTASILPDIFTKTRVWLNTQRIFIKSKVDLCGVSELKKYVIHKTMDNSKGYFPIDVIHGIIELPLKEDFTLQWGSYCQNVYGYEFLPSHFTERKLESFQKDYGELIFVESDIGTILIFDRLGNFLTAISDVEWGNDAGFYNIVNFKADENGVVIFACGKGVGTSYTGTYNGYVSVIVLNSNYNHLFTFGKDDGTFNHPNHMAMSKKYIAIKDAQATFQGSSVYTAPYIKVFSRVDGTYLRGFTATHTATPKKGIRLPDTDRYVKTKVNIYYNGIGCFIKTKVNNWHNDTTAADNQMYVDYAGWILEGIESDDTGIYILTQYDGDGFYVFNTYLRKYDWYGGIIYEKPIDMHVIYGDEKPYYSDFKIAGEFLFVFLSRKYYAGDAILRINKHTGAYSGIVNLTDHYGGYWKGFTVIAYTISVTVKTKVNLEQQYLWIKTKVDLGEKLGYEYIRSYVDLGLPYYLWKYYVKTKRYMVETSQIVKTRITFFEELNRIRTKVNLNTYVEKINIIVDLTTSYTPAMTEDDRMVTRHGVGAVRIRRFNWGTHLRTMRENDDAYSMISISIGTISNEKLGFSPNALVVGTPYGVYMNDVDIYREVSMRDVTVNQNDKLIYALSIRIQNVGENKSCVLSCFDFFNNWQWDTPISYHDKGNSGGGSEAISIVWANDKLFLLRGASSSNYLHVTNPEIATYDYLGGMSNQIFLSNSGFNAANEIIFDGTYLIISVTNYTTECDGLSIIRMNTDLTIHDIIRIAYGGIVGGTAKIVWADGTRMLLTGTNTTNDKQMIDYNGNHLYWLWDDESDERRSGNIVNYIVSDGKFIYDKYYHYSGSGKPYPNNENRTWVIDPEIGLPIKSIPHMKYPSNAGGGDSLLNTDKPMAYGWHYSYRFVHTKVILQTSYEDGQVAEIPAVTGVEWDTYIQYPTMPITGTEPVTGL